MLELATRPVEQIEEAPEIYEDVQLPLLKRVPAPAPPVLDARAARLRALAEAANPAYVRVFVPKPPVPKQQQLCTIFDTTFWTVMAICAGVLIISMACLGTVAFMFASGMLK